MAETARNRSRVVDLLARTLLPFVRFATIIVDRARRAISSRQYPLHDNVGTRFEGEIGACKVAGIHDRGIPAPSLKETFVKAEESSFPP